MLNNHGLTPHQRRQFDEEGYLSLRGVFSPAQIEGMKRVFAGLVDQRIAQLKSEGVIQDEGKGLPLETRLAVVAGKHVNRFGRSWRVGIISRELYELHRTPALVEAMAAILGPEVRGHVVWNARPKLPGQQFTVVPWHQDSGYFGPESANSRIITVWVPLVPVDASMGTLQVIPGTHRGKVVEHRTEEREGGFLEIVGKVDDSKAVTCDMEPGDALIFGNLVYHRSLATTKNAIRWSLDMRFYPEGDHPGSVHWPNPADKWVIRSASEPETSYETWRKMTEGLVW